LIILYDGSIYITYSINYFYRKGGLISRPQAIVLLLALNRSYLYNPDTFLTNSYYIAILLGALWKYRYPPKSSSAPSPDKHILIPKDLIYLANRYIGVAALTVVLLYVSVWYTTSSYTSNPY